jgi:hypothetical protein
MAAHARMCEIGSSPWCSVPLWCRAAREQLALVAVRRSGGIRVPGSLITPPFPSRNGLVTRGAAGARLRLLHGMIESDTDGSGLAGLSGS